MQPGRASGGKAGVPDPTWASQGKPSLSGNLELLTWSTFPWLSARHLPLLGEHAPSAPTGIQGGSSDPPNPPHSQLELPHLLFLLHGPVPL